MITPIVKPFVEKATDRDWLWALALMFVISSLLPTMNKMGAGFTGYLMAGSPYVFIYMLGYWLCWKAPKRIFGNVWLLAAVIALCLCIIVAKCYWGWSYFGYADPVTICLASALFLLFKSLNVNWTLANVLAPYCFGVYLVHNVFINFAFKYLNVATDVVVPITNFLGFFLLFSVLSFASTWVMMKIPLLKKHIL